MKKIALAIMTQMIIVRVRKEESLILKIVDISGVEQEVLEVKLKESEKDEIYVKMDICLFMCTYCEDMYFFI